MLGCSVSVRSFTIVWNACEIPTQPVASGPADRHRKPGCVARSNVARRGASLIDEDDPSAPPSNVSVDGSGTGDGAPVSPPGYSAGERVGWIQKRLLADQSSEGKRDWRRTDRDGPAHEQDGQYTEDESTKHDSAP